MGPAGIITSKVFPCGWLVEQSKAEIRGFGMPISDAMLDRSLDPDLIPATRPAYETFWTDPAGRTWVRVSTADTLQVTLDVFDAEGRWLDQLDVAEPLWAANSFIPVAFGADRLAIAIEDEAGLPLVRIYRIEGPRP